jgi:hypothetical protein
MAKSWLINKIFCTGFDFANCTDLQAALLDGWEPFSVHHYTDGCAFWLKKSEG